ncbi:hypothetical protein H7171_03890 [Candidatus Saccharibacteria bacterium]|nr:hypothetical protein [Candidatus Saccharibacteria bacterium]
MIEKGEDCAINFGAAMPSALGNTPRIIILEPGETFLSVFVTTPAALGPKN